MPFDQGVRAAHEIMRWWLWLRWSKVEVGLFAVFVLAVSGLRIEARRTSRREMEKWGRCKTMRKFFFFLRAK